MIKCPVVQRVLLADGMECGALFRKEFSPSATKS